MTFGKLSRENVEALLNASLVHVGLFRAQDERTRTSFQISLDEEAATVTLDARVFHTMCLLIGTFEENQQPTLEAVTQLRGNATRLEACESRIRSARQVMKMAIRP